MFVIEFGIFAPVKRRSGVFTRTVLIDPCVMGFQIMHVQRYLENSYLRTQVSRTFVKNLIWLQALNWLVKPIWILWIERTVQVQLGNEWYGQYFVHFNLGLLFAVLLDAGLNAYVSREVASKGRLTHRNRVLALRMFFGAIYVLMVAIVAYQQQLDVRILAFVVVNQILASILLLMRAVVQGRQLFISDGLLSVSDRLIAIVLSAWFLFGSHTFAGLNGIVVFLLAQTAGYGFAVLLGWYLLRFEGNRRTAAAEIHTHYDSLGSSETGAAEIHTHYDSLGSSETGVAEIHTNNESLGSSKTGAAEINTHNDSLGSSETGAAPIQEEVPSFGRWTKEVVWFVAMALFMSIFTRIDALMIRNLSPDMFGKWGIDSGYFQAGIYAQSYRLLDAGLIFSTLLSTQLLPIFSRNIEKGQDNTHFVWLSFRLVWLVGLSALFTAYIWGNEILELLYGAKWEGGGETQLAQRSGWIFVVLMGAFVAMSSIHVLGTFITAEGRMKWLTGLALFSMILNMAANFFLIPRFGALGAAMSAVITQWFFAAACAARVWKSNTVQTRNIKWKVIPMSAFYGLILALGLHNVQWVSQKIILEFLVWLLFIMGLVWHLFGENIKKSIQNVL